MSPICIAQAFDGLVVRRLYKATFPADAWDLAKDALIWVARVDDKPVGFVSLERTWADDGWYVSRIGVIESARGQKVARKLLRAVDRHVEAAKRGGIVTYVLSHNGASIKTFIEAEYQVYAPENLWAGEGAVYFIKEIGAA